MCIFMKVLHPFDYRGLLMSIAIVGECIEERQTLSQEFHNGEFFDNL